MRNQSDEGLGIRGIHGQDALAVRHPLLGMSQNQIQTGEPTEDRQRVGIELESVFHPVGGGGVALMFLERPGRAECGDGLNLLAILDRSGMKRNERLGSRASKCKVQGQNGI